MTSPPLGPPPLIDRAVLDELFEAIGADGGRSVLELFLAESRDYLAAIAAAASGAAGRDQARRAAHALKSGAGQIGAAALSAAAAAVERAAESAPGSAPGSATENGTSDLAPVAAVLDACAEETVAAIEALLRAP